MGFSITIKYSVELFDIIFNFCRNYSALGTIACSLPTFHKYTWLLHISSSQHDKQVLYISATLHGKQAMYAYKLAFNRRVSYTQLEQKHMQNL